MQQFRGLFTFLVVFMASSLPFAGHDARAATDDTVVRSTVGRFAEIWNRHDAASLAALFAPDADFVDITANWYKGRQNIQAEIAFLFAAIPKDSVTVTLPPQAYGALKAVSYRFDRTDIRFLTKDIAVAHVAWTQLGDPRFKDKPRQGLLTFIVAREGDHWMINAGHNSPRP